MDTMTIVPAYGRKYNHLIDMQKDWDDGKDFKIEGGPYCSIRDIKRFKENGIQFLELTQRTFPFLTISLNLEHR